MNPPVIDLLRRPLESLRISVTDRCNLRCTYCMPKAAFAHHQFLAPDHLLSFAEIERLARIFIHLGVRKIRLTGGEPLVRPGLPDLVRRLVALPGLDELALSTNGLLLRSQAEALHEAGLRRINLSLDAINDGVFGVINGLNRPVKDVLEGVEAALEHGFRIKVNMVVQRGINEAQILPMARHFAARKIPLRFIEFMDVGNVNGWQRDQVMSGSEIRKILATEFDLVPTKRPDGDTSQNFYCERIDAVFGFVDSVTQPFCRDCNRLRLSADGRIFTCLFAESGRDLCKAIRSGASDRDLTEQISSTWNVREDRYSELRASQIQTGAKIEMSYIGG